LWTTASPLVIFGGTGVDEGIAVEAGELAPGTKPVRSQVRKPPQGAKQRDEGAQTGA
jgi:hypothetical protein